MSDYVTHCSESSFIKTIMWSSESQTLIIRFSSGTIWAYYRVPKKEYLALSTAPSAGHYFNVAIRDIYASERVAYSSEIEKVFTVGQEE